MKPSPFAICALDAKFDVDIALFGKSFFMLLKDCRQIVRMHQTGPGIERSRKLLRLQAKQFVKLVRPFNCIGHQVPLPCATPSNLVRQLQSLLALNDSLLAAFGSADVGEVKVHIVCRRNWSKRHQIYLLTQRQLYVEYVAGREHAVSYLNQVCRTFVTQAKTPMSQ